MIRNKSIRKLIGPNKAGKEKFITIITHNWKKKIICFALSLLLFIYNMNKEWTLNGKSFKVPLTIKTGELVVSAPYTPTVSFTVHDSTEDLKKLSEADFNAYIDTTYITAEGDYSFPILLELSENALSLDPLEIKVTPESLRLSLEQRIDGFINIEPLFGGKPAFGYEVTSVSVEPSQLEVSGPKSLVKNAGNLVAQTKPLSIDGMKTSVEQKVNVQVPNAHLDAQSTEATIFIKISPIRTTKTFEKIPVKLINVSPELEIVRQPEPVTLTFEGNQADLEDYKIPNNFVTVDCSAIHVAGAYNMKLTVNSPKYFSESSSNPKTISVVFNENQNADENIREN
ncbi:MAG: hypothetical protein II921_06210 [Treponema sp.]|nr:hypothetical protein [Treponema sp.]